MRTETGWFWSFGPDKHRMFIRVVWWKAAVGFDFGFLDGWTCSFQVGSMKRFITGTIVRGPE